MPIEVRVNPNYDWGEGARSAGLTRSEAEVIGLVAQGYNNPEIAEILRIRYQSVKNHVYSLKKKLKAKSTAQALLIAIGENVIRVDNTDLDIMSNKKSRNMDKFWDVLERLVRTEDTALAKKIKKWMIRNGIDVDI